MPKASYKTCQLRTQSRPFQAHDWIWRRPPFAVAQGNGPSETLRPSILLAPFILILPFRDRATMELATTHILPQRARV